MKKVKSILLVIVLSIIVVFTYDSALAQESYSYENMVEIYKEELQAKDMYEQLIEKFDNDEFYQRIHKAEINHSSIMERLLNSFNYQTSQIEFQPVQVSDNELQALKEAYEFELKDVEDLKEKISQSENEREIQAYEKLLFGSTNHAKALEKAIQAYESGESDLENLRLAMKNGQRKNISKNIGGRSNSNKVNKNSCRNR